MILGKATAAPHGAREPHDGPGTQTACFGGSLSLGALTLLTGCDISDHDSVQRALACVSRFNDRVQAAIFRPDKLAPTFPEAER